MSTDSPKKKTRKKGKRRLGDAVFQAEAQTVIFLCEGQLIAGQYRIIEQIGTGGMGVVYKARDESLDRIVAVKALPPDMACNEAAVTRLKKEALAVIELHHPNIMALYQFVSEANSGYLIMEYLDGPDLDKALAEKDRFTVDEMIEVASQVGSALDYAHKRGIIHRDIKPGNLLYTREGDEEVVKVADFGIAYQVRNSIAKLTGEATSGGTMCYMPPEQLAGKKTTGQSDQYALAVSLYELLEGRPPFNGTGMVLINQINTIDAEPIDNVPDYVNDAFLKALSKNPEDRFKSCSEFTQCLAGKASSSVEPQVNQGNRKSLSFPLILVVVMLFATFLGANYHFGFLNLSKNSTSNSDIGTSSGNNIKVSASSTKIAADLLVAAKLYGDQKKLEQLKNALAPVSSLPESVKLIPDWGALSVTGKPVHGTFKLLAVDGDDAPKGEFPFGTTVNELTAGRYLVVCNAKYHRKVEREVIISASDEPFKITDVVLEQKQTWFILDSNPTGATVFLNGTKFPGETPFSLGIGQGKHTLYVEKGDLAYSDMIVLDESKVKIVAKLKRANSGTRKSFKSQTGIEFVWVPPGKFIMGSSLNEVGRVGNEGPPHWVTFSKGFWMGKYEVTQWQWHKIMSSIPSEFGGDENPVESVSWNDCQKFIEKLNEYEGDGDGKFLLPTEAQWEYACRAGESAPFTFGSNINTELVNYDGNYPYNNASKGVNRKKTLPVGSLHPNRWGLYEMHGNVWEWCRDNWHEDYVGAPTDGSMWSGKSSNRVYRGGGWNRGAKYCRSAYRYRFAPDFSCDRLGLRLVFIED